MPLTNPWFLLAAIPVFGLCVLIHELGHFLTAKWAGIRVEEFGLGLPPRIVGFRKRHGRGWEVVWFSAARNPEDTYGDTQSSALDTDAAGDLSRAASVRNSEDIPNARLDRPEDHHTIYSLN